MHVIVSTHDLQALLRSARQVYSTPADVKAIAALGDTLDRFQADEAVARPANPFGHYRSEICGGYSTAYRLRSLVKHLYNGDVHPVRLDNLLASADEQHAAIALRLIAWYAQYGENCTAFMRLARELVEQDQAAANLADDDE